MSPRQHPSILVLASLLVWLFADGASSHDQRFGIEGERVVLRVDGASENRRFLFKARGQADLSLEHSPIRDGLWLHVSSTDPELGHTGLIRLRRSGWSKLRRKGELVGFRYEDEEGRRAGIRKVTLKDGIVRIRARGERWSWVPEEPLPGLRVQLRLEDEWFCAEFGGRVRRSEAAFFKAELAPSPGGCPDATCGNGVLEIGEECDDGNLVEDDGCTSRCAVGPCAGAAFESSFDAIQEVVFEGYDCTNALCHGSENAAGGLVLEEGASWEQLVGVAAVGSLEQLKRVEPGDPDRSFLFHKLAAATLGGETGGGSPMPLPGAKGPGALSRPHLEALELWIRGGAPRDRVVEGTARRLATCLPPPDPLVIEPLAPPPAGDGFQVRQPPRPLPAGSESEICTSAFYDLTGTDLVPPEWIVPCPPALQFQLGCSEDPSVSCEVDRDCSGSCVPLRNALNPEGLCIRYSRHVYAQDPQSHHALAREYRGGFPLDHPSWGGWTYRFADAADPRNGQPCDPEGVDPATGVNAGCGSAVIPSVGCVGYGPPDFTVFDFSKGLGSILTGGAGTPSIAFAAEPYLERRFPDGASDFLPLRGLITWNSHAFNLTAADSTLTQYLNLYVVDPREHPTEVADFFDANSIFVPNVPPFEAREYCKTFEVPEGQELFELTSHTHRHGVRFRVWPPPNEPCLPGQPACVPRREADAIYVSTDYADPLQLQLDPPIAHPEADPAERSYLYCAIYDNGSTPSSPPAKRRSTSPPSPTVFGFSAGGPCGDATVACANEGPMRGRLCGGDDRVCDSAPEAGDGDCDACPVLGGLTTEDEMFALPGSLVVPPGSAAE